MLLVRPFDIEIGQHKVMLNIVDARERGLNPGDRVRVRAKGAATTALLDTTTQMVNPGEIGIFTEPSRNLVGPAAPGLMSKSKISVGIQSVAQALGMSTTPEIWP